jgi:hypothetical protein
MRYPVRCIARLTLLLLTLVLLFPANIAFAAAVVDQVELKATHQAGVPLHNEPSGDCLSHRGSQSQKRQTAVGEDSLDVS